MRRIIAIGIVAVALTGCGRREIHQETRIVNGIETVCSWTEDAFGRKRDLECYPTGAQP